jgi:dUTP pyrophosphatase
MAATFSSSDAACVLRVLLDAPNAVLPERKSAGAAGYDLVCANVSEVVIEPGRSCLVSTGLSLSLPENTVGLIKGRSSLAALFDVTVDAGVIDEDYRGEIRVLLRNHGRGAYKVSPGSRIAQLLIVPIVKPVPVSVPILNVTVRGDGGFGSTGL